MPVYAKINPCAKTFNTVRLLMKAFLPCRNSNHLIVDVKDACPQCICSIWNNEVMKNFMGTDAFTFWPTGQVLRHLYQDMETHTYSPILKSVTWSVVSRKFSNVETHSSD